MIPMFSHLLVFLIVLLLKPLGLIGTVLFGLMILKDAILLHGVIRVNLVMLKKVIYYSLSITHVFLLLLARYILIDNFQLKQLLQH